MHRRRRYGGAVLLLLTGAAVLRITLFGDLYLRYVQAGLRPYLIVSGAALILLGLVTAALTGKVEIRGADAPPTDAWVTVTGTWRPQGTLGSDEAWPPLLDATTVTRVRQPSDPYEKP